MTIEEAIDYAEDINKTVIWTKTQKIEEEFYNNVAEWLQELKAIKENNHDFFTRYKNDAYKRVEQAMYHQCFECDNDEYMQNGILAIGLDINCLKMLWNN